MSTLKLLAAIGWVLVLVELIFGIAINLDQHQQCQRLAAQSDKQFARVRQATAIIAACYENRDHCQVCRQADRQWCGMKLHHVSTAKEIMVWDYYYTGLMNVRYRELTSDDGLKADWQKFADKLKLIYDAKTENTLDDRQLDDFYFEKWRIQKREIDQPDMKNLRQAQRDVNMRLFGVEEYDDPREPIGEP